MSMLRRRSGIAVGATLLLLFLASENSAYAYIDPGTGSYVIQVLAASVLALAFVIKSTWRSILDTVVRLCKRRPDGH